MGSVLETILMKQAEFANLDYKTLDHSKWIEYEWTQDQEIAFSNWMNDYVYSLKKKELEEITDFTSLVHKKKKNIALLVYQFIFQYGFKTKNTMTELIYPPKDFLVETGNEEINQPIFPVNEQAFVSDMLFGDEDKPFKTVAFYPSMTLWYIKQDQIENLCGFLQSNNIKVSVHG